MQDEMSAHVETALKADLWLDEHDGKRSLVDRSRFGGAQDVAGVLRVEAIDNDGFEALACDLANDFVRSGEMLDADLEVVKDTTQDADGFIVRTPQ